MKKEKFSYLYIYLILILILIILFVSIPKIRENFIANKIKIKKSKNESEKKDVVNLSCKIGKDNEYNCTRFESKPIVKNIKMNYPPLLYDVGIGPKSSSGTIKFNKKFESIPKVYCTPILENKKISNIKFSKIKEKKEDDEADISSLNISISNITPTGFNYKKSKISAKKEYNGLTNLSNDEESTFNWLALAEPPKDPFEILDNS